MIKGIFNKLMEIFLPNANDHTSAYAAMSAFFFMLSLIPTILLMLTLVQYTSLTKVDIMSLVVRIVPENVTQTALSIVNQVYNQSSAIIPITMIVALWSAGRGVLAITAGLNWVYNSKETRNYLFLRIRATFYTVFFIVVIITTLVALGFGNSISLFVEKYIPIASHITKFMIQIRLIATFIGMTVFSMFIYRFLPNRKGNWGQQIPGALFTSIGWQITSLFVSKYLEIFKGFANMYGSLTTIVLIMLWLYFSMYIMLLGGRLNRYLQIKKWEKS